MSHYYQVPRYCGIYYISPNVNYVHQIPTPSWIPQVSLSTDSRLHDTASSTVLTQTFVNPLKTNTIEKAKYTFPLYESCAVVSFRCFVGKRLIEGVVKEKEEAKAEYNEAVAQGETAALLEHHTPDVFCTSLGNIPAGETVKVEIEYIMELKHDAEVDGLRFTIPTSIAPRYGEAPINVPTLDGQPIPGAIQSGMKISVRISMPSNIRSVQSPSHSISMHLGGHVEDVADDDFNPKYALATLSQKSTELGADFVLLIKCADLSSPRALLETHPTLANSKALMVTLVPKFTLPSGPKPEIVFIVDRSGSMTHRMAALKSALSVFLKSLPIGVKFNICSFGSTYSFLWKNSQPYSADSLQAAQEHVDSMKNNLGGTQILEPVNATVQRRYKDIPLEMMVLTDGEVWDTEPIFKYIEMVTASGDIRLFSLGIGKDVSHSLVEGMARVGRGFAQIVADETEGIEGKVVRMLRAGLSAHINDYRLEWDERPSEQAGFTKRKDAAAKGAKKKISLFDNKADTDAPISPKGGAGRYAHLPDFTVPAVMQAPYRLPPLFPFSRFTAYIIFSGDLPTPSSVYLRGTAPSGDDLELEIPVQVESDRASTIHQLAARKILQELEEGTGYLHSGKYGVDPENNPGTFSEWVAREGTRVGLTYGLASKWTSFVALKKNEKAAAAADNSTNMDIDTIESVTEVDDEEEYELVDNVRNVGAPPPPGGFATDRFRASGPGPRVGMAYGASKSGGSTRLSDSIQGGAERKLSLAAAPATKSVLPTRMTATLLVKSKRKSRGYDSVCSSVIGGGMPGPSDYAMSSPSAVPYVTSLSPQRANAPGLSLHGRAKTPSLSPRELAKALIALQAFEGSFLLTDTFATIIGIGLTDLMAKLGEFISQTGAGLKEEEMQRLWATVLAVIVFEGRLKGEKEMWELVVEKARAWIMSLGDVGVDRLEGLAGEMLQD